MGALCANPIWPPLTRDDLAAAHEIATRSALVQHLRKKATTPHLRLVHRDPVAGNPPAEIGPVIRLFQNEIMNCAPGTTYILPLSSQMGKSMASQFVIDNLRGRSGLYFSAEARAIVADSLKYELNTTLEAPALVYCLVAALGKTGGLWNQQAGGPPPLLILDEVNLASVENKAFIQSIFLRVAADRGMVCVILTNYEETANDFIALNGGKIRPFPGVTVDGWGAGAKPTWLNNVTWTRDDLTALIQYQYKNVLLEKINMVFTDQFPADGDNPGEVLRMVDMRIAQGEFA